MSDIAKDIHPDTYIGLGLPLEHDEGFFPRTKRIADQAQYNLVNLLRTIPGERLANPDFGCNLSWLLFEPAENVGEGIEEEITRVVQVFLPYIDIKEIEVNNTGQNTVNVHIRYTLSIGVATSNEIDLEFQNLLQENMSISDDENQTPRFYGS